MARALRIAPVLIVLAAGLALAQGDPNSVREQLEERFEILPIADGIVLTPRFTTSVRSIEVSETTIAIDGVPVSGAELRKRLGEDADAVLRLSYLDPQERRSVARVAERPAPVAPSTPEPPRLPDLPEPPRLPGLAEPPPLPDLPRDPGDDAAGRDSESRPARRARERDDIVRIGGSVSIASDESIDGDVVVIGGSARVDGQVDGEVVVVGGSAVLGPQADIRRDVTVVGGRLSRDPKAIIRGGVREIGFGEIPWGGGRWVDAGDWRWNPVNGLYPIAQLTGTLVRLALLMLFVSLVMFVARTPVEQIADRVATEPVKAWIVGFLAQILFVPVLVMTIVVLAISIIGIPLLLLVPVAIFAGIVALLVGFTGVAYHFGRVLQQRVDPLRGRPYAATFAGIVLVLSPLLLARLVGLIAFVDDFGFIVGMLFGVGVLLEYMAWTAGLGAAALARFGGRSAPPPVVTPPPMIGA